MHDDMSHEPSGTAPGAEPETLPPTTQFPGAASYTPEPSGAFGPRSIQLSFGPKSGRPTPDESLWEEIRRRTLGLSFAQYAAFVDSVLCDPVPPGGGLAAADGLEGGKPVPSYRSDAGRKLQAGLRAHLHGPDAYLLLQIATEAFLMHVACEPTDEFLRSPYLVELGQGRALPYLALIRDRLRGVPVGARGALALGTDEGCYAIANPRLFAPCFLELIWSYWHEQGMLVQTINTIAIRYQNIRYGEGRDPLAGFELDPLRPLNSILWGYLQEEHRRLSVVRRAYEYDHHYGLRIYGKAIPEFRPADSRAKFLPAFHELLFQAHAFFKDDDIATVQADSFPVLNALRELHFVLAEGMHNQFGDLPTQARAEMLIQQWLLARPEIRDFLRGRVSVPYPEPWMDCVDTMKTLQGWSDVPVLYFNELAVTGEQLLLSVRYADWATQTPTSTESAANWARFHRSVIQRYLYAYRMVTGVDLTVDRIEIQSAQARDGQPPIRARVAGRTRAPARRVYEAAPPEELPAPATQRALPGRGGADYTGLPALPRAGSRERRP